MMKSPTKLEHILKLIPGNNREVFREEIEAYIAERENDSRIDELHGVAGALMEATEDDAHATTDSTFEYVEQRLDYLSKREKD